MSPRSLFIGFIALVLGATSAAAQVLDLPPRPSRGVLGGGPPPDPNRSRQNFEIEGNFLGGYEDNLVPQGANVFETYPGGYTGFTDATVRYSVGKPTKGMELGGSGFVSTYRSIGLGPSYGGTQTATVRSPLGRRTSLFVNERIAYTPYFSLRLFDSALVAPTADESQAAGPPTQATNPSTALAPVGSWLTHASGAINHSFNRNIEISAGYAFDQQTYLDKVAYDSVAQAGILGLDRSLTKNFRLRASYRFSSTQFTQPSGLEWPLRTNTIEGGSSYIKRLSPTRQLVFEGGAGAVQSHLVEANSGLALDDWSPSGYGTVRLDFRRSWSIAADYRRAVLALQGARPESFISDSATIAVGGFLSRTVEAILAFGYSSGSNLPSPTVIELGTYEGFNGSAQVRFRLSRYLAVLVNGSRYQYELNDAAAVSLRVPRQLNRNAVRVGVTWLLPVVGTYLDDPRPINGRN
jgi:hypothetical protein